MEAGGDIPIHVQLELLSELHVENDVCQGAPVSSHALQCSIEEWIFVQYCIGIKVPFPGIGNDLKLELPVNVTSGIEQPLAKESTDGEDTPPILDLPPCVH